MIPFCGSTWLEIGIWSLTKSLKLTWQNNGEIVCNCVYVYFNLLCKSHIYISIWNKLQHILSSNFQQWFCFPPLKSKLSKRKYSYFEVKLSWNTITSDYIKEEKRPILSFKFQNWIRRLINLQKLYEEKII